MPVWIAFAVAMVGLCSIVTPLPAWLSLSLVAATAIGLSTLSLQIARLLMSIRWLAIGTTLALILPASIWCSSWIVLPRVSTLTTATVIDGIAVAGGGVALLLGTRTLASCRVPRSGARSALRSSVPLVPHLIAFGALTQGPRLAMTLAGGSSELLVQASYAMQFMGIGFAGVASVHGVLSASLQSASSDRFRETSVNYAWSYAILGVFASLAVPLALVTPIRRLFAGMVAPSAGQLVAMSLCFAALTGYYLQSTSLLRLERTSALAWISVPVVTVYLAVASSIQDITGQFWALAAALAAMQLAAASYLLIRSPRDRAVVLGSLIPATVTYSAPIIVWVTTILAYA